MTIRTRTLLVLVPLLFGNGALRAEAPAAPNTPTNVGAGQKLDVKDLQKKYWTGKEQDVEAVQNRLYAKEQKFHLGIFGGLTSTDPFLNVKSYGATAGFHINESFSINALYLRHSAKASSAEEQLRQFNGKTANTNNPLDYKALEVAFYPMYGKLSLLGQSIAYFDSFILAGGGLAGTESGDYGAFHVGVGAQLYLTRYLNLRLDYRLQHYTDRIKSKNAPIGDDLGSRSLWNGITTLGISTLF